MKNFLQTFTNFFLQKNNFSNRVLVFLILTCSLFSTQQLHAQCSGLQVIGFMSGTPDVIYLQATSNIPANTIFHITDNEWTGSGFNNTSEGEETWTSPSTVLPAGSIIQISGSTSSATATCGTASGVPNLAASGDEIFITSSAPATSGMTTNDVCFGVIFLNGSSANLTGITGVNLGSTAHGAFNSGDITDPNDWSIDNNSANLTFPTASCAASSSPEINVQDAGMDVACGATGTTIFNAGSVSTASGTAPITVTIQNTGTSDLNISALTIGGTNPSDFTITSPTTFPIVVAASGSTNVTISFDPSVDGARAATLTIANDDADEASCILPLNGTGTPTAATPITFDALPDCDDMLGGAGTSAAANTMYVHISNLNNLDISAATTFTSSAGTVVGSIAAGAPSGTIQITGLTAANYGTVITLTANNNGNTNTVQLPVIICGFNVQNGGNGLTPNATTNGVFCADQNGVTGPGVLVESVPSTALTSGNNITSTYVYVLVDTDNSDAIIAQNNSGLFSAPNVVSGTNYEVYAFNVNNADLSTFEGAIVPGTTAIDDITGMMGSFATLCYSNCWNVVFSPDCFVCPTLTTLTDPADICVGDNFDAITASGFTAAQMNQTIGGGAFGIQFVTFTGNTAPTDAYTGGTNLGAVTNANLTTSDTEATLAANTVGSSLAVGTYQLCAILSPTPTAATCRPQVCQTVVINPLPVATVNDPVVCMGTTSETLTVTATSGTPTTYTIDFDATAEGAGFADVTTVTSTTSATFVIPNGAAAATYNGVITFIDANGCSGTDPFTITINANPVATVNDPAVCMGTTSETLTVTATSGTPTTYTIDFDATAEGAGFADVTTATSTTGANFVIPNSAAAATYNGVITYFDANGCSGTDPFTVTVNQPVVVEAGSPTSICSTGTIDLNGLGASISGGTNTGTWTSTTGGTFDNSGVFGSATIYTPSTADIAAGTVTLTLTATGALSPCPNESDTVTITISNVSCNGSFPWNGNN